MPRRNLFVELVATHLATTADRPAIRTAAGEWTHEELVALVGRTAERLLEQGAQSGDRVLLVLPNSVEYLVGVLAVSSLGCVAVPLSPDSGSERLRFAIDSTSPRLSLGPERHGIGHPSPSLEKQTIDAAMILFSSGSTGRPKGVVLSHANLISIAHNLARTFGFGPEHRELILSSMTHSGAWQRAAATLGAGGCVVLADGPLSIPGLLEDVARHAIRGFYTPPPLARYLLAAPPAEVRSALAGVDSIEIGSAPFDPDELQRLLDLLPTTRIFVHYGLTECSRGTLLDARAHPGKLDTVGCPSSGTEVTIRDDQMRALAPGERGQIVLRGPQMARGYWGDPVATADAFRDVGVLTGDHGSLDGEGFLHFVGREDDRINSAGYSFFPAEVEAELGRIDGVTRYLVAGVPDPRGVLGQVPYVFVVPSDPAHWSPATLMAAARERLAPYMVPRRVLVVPALAETPSGKGDRRRTVALYASAAPEE